MGAGLEHCVVGHAASVTIVTRDKSGGACKSGNAILSAEVCYMMHKNEVKRIGALTPHIVFKTWFLFPPLWIQVFTPDGSIVDGEIVDHKNGTYEFVYIVPKEGDFSLALRLYDQHIKGSPFKLTVSKASEVEVGGANMETHQHNLLSMSCQRSQQVFSSDVILITHLLD